MNILKEPNSLVAGLMFSIPQAGEYKKSQFNFLREIDDSYVLFNTLTRQVVALTSAEYEFYKSDRFIYDNDNIMMSEFIKKNLLVKKDLDENKLYKEILQIVRQTSTFSNKKIIQYKIFTTTYCNARCFYCFEEGMGYNHMTLETAENIVRYILKTHYDDEITLYWFGGEPLCNVSVIDYICKKLKEENIRYNSKIISNGYLFDAELIKKAVEEWNLIFAQITLDGMEKEHNKRKSYINPKVSPFKKTIDNIRLLLENDIFVSVRLNFDENNVSDINTLIDTVLIDFKEYKKFKAYPAILSNDWLNHKGDRVDDTEQELHSEFLKILKKLENLGMYKTGMLSKTIKPYYCMAANPACATISAKGELYTCQSCDDKMCLGNVELGIVKNELLNQWENCFEESHKCVDCAFLPECAPFNKCPSEKNHCIIDKEYTITKQLTRVLREEKSAIEDEFDLTIE